MKRYRRPYNFSTPHWMRNIQTILHDCIIPLTIFQAIRTLLFPNFLDFVLLIVFIYLTVRSHYNSM